MNRLVYTKAAARQIEAAVDWIASHSPSSAMKWLETLIELIEGPVTNDPERFGFAAEAALSGKPVRQALFGKRQGQFRILFISKGSRVWIVQVRRAAQDHMSAGDLAKLPGL